MLNWSVEAIVILLSGIPIFFGVLLLFKQYLQHHDRIFGLLTLSWFLQALYLTQYGFAYLFLEDLIIRINAFFLVINMFSLIVLYDFMANSGEVDARKTAIAGALAVFLIYSAWLPESVIPSEFDNGEPSLRVSGLFRIATSLTATFMGLIYLYYAILILQNVPDNLKFWARINLFGVFSFSFLVIIFFAMGWTSIIPGIANILSAFGGLLAIYAFVQSPKLIYVLPFTARKLLVINSNSGTSLYAHNWVDRMEAELSDDLISSALSGLSAFTSEAVRAGKIREIVLDDGVLYVKSTMNYQFVLISSSPSEVLNNNLERFSYEFSKKFPKGPKSSDTTPYRISKDLVDQVFPYIPNYETESY